MPVLTLRFALDGAPLDILGSSSSTSSHDAKRQRLGRREAEAPASASPAVSVRLVEFIRELQDTSDHDDATHFGLFVWPSAEVLAHFLARHRASVVRGKVVLEIGCGTGLPGILAAVCGEPAAVYLTDRSDAADIRRNVEANIALNGIGGSTRFLALDWGRVDADAALLAVFASVDVLLAADCFYRSEDFEKVLASVALVFRCNPRCKLYVTYQLRSITRSIAPLLARWHMRAEAIDTSVFLPSDTVGSWSDDDDDDDVEGERDVSEQRRALSSRAQSYDSVFLYEISSTA